MATATVGREKRSRMTISFSLAAYYRNENSPLHRTAYGSCLAECIAVLFARKRWFARRTGASISPGLLSVDRRVEDDGSAGSADVNFPGNLISLPAAR